MWNQAYIFFCKHSGAISCDIFCSKSRGAGFQKWLYVADIASNQWHRCILLKSAPGVADVATSEQVKAESSRT